MWLKYFFTKAYHSYLIIVLISCIIISLSSGLEVATNIVTVAKASLLILSFPSLYSALFFSKKYKNIVAPILLFPSIKLWFLTIKYNNALALSSSVGYKSLPPKLWYIVDILLLNESSLSIANWSP